MLKKNINDKINILYLIDLNLNFKKISKTVNELNIIRILIFLLNKNLKELRLNGIFFAKRKILIILNSRP